MLSCVKFIGLQKRDAVLQQYNESDALVFPSKLETWGLPITEIKLYNKTILVANCRYAYETVGNYGKACFFDPNDPLHLSGLMEKAINYSLVFDTPASTAPQQPFTKNWKELFSLILS